MEEINSTSIVKEMSISVSEPSNENPPSIDEPSQENPTTTDLAEETTVENDFSFQLYPAIKMKQAIACLCDEQFNPRGFGVIDVDAFGFEITVPGSESGAVGHLWLDANLLINFKYNKPMTVKLKRVNLNHLYHNLADAADNDTIYIHHSHGSNQIAFSFGNDPRTEFSEELVELKVEYIKFPKIVYACQAVLLRDPFLEMIRDYENAPNPKKGVSSLVYIYNEMLKGKMKWQYRRKHESTMVRIQGMGRGQKHQALFQWPDCEFLKKASLLAPGALLCITRAPPRHIMMRFNMRELGDLVYLYKSDLTLFNAQLFDDIKTSDATRSKLPH
ncbi:hypothetical protein RND81_09G031700 [Saponaria officinalis]|uniref:Uncharacterized protein n=1 Tax=Saponaria officinalis TaxID=3572 RepID=A0AAW1IG77_SAPOF